MSLVHPDRCVECGREPTHDCDYSLRQGRLEGARDERELTVAYLRKVARRFAVMRSLDATIKADIIESVADCIEGEIHLGDW